MEIEIETATASQPEHNPGDDLQHIQGLLALGQGLPPFRPAAGQNRRRQRAPRGRSPQQPATQPHPRSHSQPGAYNSRRVQRDQEQGEASGTSPYFSDEEGPSLLLQQQWNRPGPRSTAKAWHCEACDCYIRKRDDDVAESPSRRNIMQRLPSGNASEWRKHVAGIRHQREVLSIRETGARGHLLVSPFEYIPAHKLQRFQYDNRFCPEIKEEISKVWTVALKALIHHTGATPEYHRLATRFSHDRLQDAWDMLARSCFPRRFFGQLSCNSVDGPVFQLGTDPAMLAVLSHWLGSGKSTHPHLELDVLMNHALDGSASLAAVSLLADSLPSSSVVRLKLSLQSWAEPSDASKRELRKVLEVFQAALNSNIGLRRLEFSFPPWFEVPHELIQTMKKGAQVARRKARLALVMGLHPRLGCKSPLSLLPWLILRIIMDKAAPLE